MNGMTKVVTGLTPIKTLTVMVFGVGLVLPTNVPALATEVVNDDTQPSQSLVAQSAVAPSVPALPRPIPAPMTPVMSGIVDLAETDATLGVGYLKPADLPRGSEGAEWLSDIALPIYGAPQGQHWGWLIRGWLVPNNQPPLAIGRDAAFAMVSLEDEDILAFPVLEVRDDGWMRVQYTSGGSAWAHSSHLTFGDTDLAVESWDDPVVYEDSLNPDQSSALQFQRPGSAQVLRSRPELNRNVISLISNDSLIVPLEVEGDWVRVRVTRPVAGCEPLGGARSDEGWMRWRNDQGEVLLVNRPSGC